jgi:hypothetical protein
MIKLCKECRWCEIDIIQNTGSILNSEYDCNHPDLLDVVSGGGTDCYILRHNLNLCGRAGKYWEAKNVG